MQLSESPVDLNLIQKTFETQTVTDIRSAESLMDYFEQHFLALYFDTRNQFMPVTKVKLLQQRSQPQECDINYNRKCEQGIKETNQTYTKIPEQSKCINSNCSEFTYFYDSAETGRPTKQFIFEGRYGLYQKLGFVINIDQYTNRQLLFQKLKKNGWFDDYTMAIVFIASVFDIKANRQIQFTFLSELPYGKEIISSTVLIQQIWAVQLSDSLQLVLLIYLCIVIILKTLRAFIEIAYKFSNFTLPFFQLILYSAFYGFILVHIYRLSVRPYNQGFLYDHRSMEGQLGITLFGLYDFVVQQQLQVVETIFLVILWIIYPFLLLYIFVKIFPNTWYRIYFNTLVRTTTSVRKYTIVLILIFFMGFYPILLLNFNIRQKNLMQATLILMGSSFLNHPQELKDGNDPTTYYYYIFDFITQLGFLIMVIYFLVIMIDSFARSTRLEVPTTTKYESELMESIGQLNVRANKFFKEIIKIIQKDEKSNFQKKDLIDSQLLDDEFLDSRIVEKKNEKILIVYEIHSQYLEEITRFQEKENQTKNFHSHKTAHLMKKFTQSVVSKIFDRSRTSQNILQRYKNNNDGAYFQINETNEEQDLDFLKKYCSRIEDQGITIRQFYILDQVVKFLKMLIGLRPEYLSPNAENRIRILFYINSPQATLDDVFKMLSFLIVNLKKDHLLYPVLIYTTRQVKQDFMKEPYINKMEYLILKKFFKNIFSSQEENCALEFSLMNTSFLELQLKYAHEHAQQNIPVEEIQNSVDEDFVAKSDAE